MREAAHRVFRLHFERMLRHEPGTRHGRDIEELHDMRVVSRRLQAALDLFRDDVDSRRVTRIARGVRGTTRALGRVRDLDVFWDKTEKVLSGSAPSQRPDLRTLHAAWSEERRNQQRRLVEHLDGPRHHKLLSEFSEYLGHTLLDGAQKRTGAGAPTSSRLVRDAAPAVIRQRLAEVLTYDGLVSQSSASLDALHQLRIAAKGLRYSLECFREMMGPAGRSLIERVKALQDHLGDLNDARVANQLLRGYVTAGEWPDQVADTAHVHGQAAVNSDPGAVLVLAARKRELEVLRQTVAGVWRPIASPSFVAELDRTLEAI